MQTVQVIVAGGGIGGLTAAAALAAAGLEVTVHERRPDLTEAEGGAIVLAENLLLALDSLGATEDAIRDGDAKRSFSYADAQGRAHTPSRSNLSGGRYYYVSRAGLHHALLNAALRAGATVVPASGVRSASPDGTVVFENGDQARAELVVGADGVGSSIRRSLGSNGGTHGRAGIRAQVRPLAHYGVITLLDQLLPETEQGHMTERWNGSLRIGYGWLGDGTSGVYLSCGADGLSADRHALDLDRWVKAFPDQSEIIRAVAASRPKVSSLSEVVCSSWSDGRVALLGDAAHAMPPHRGQGAAMAVLDGIHLGQVFRRRELLGSESGVQDMLRQWEAEVRPVVRRTQRNAVAYCRAQSHWPAALLPLRPWCFRSTAKRVRRLDLGLLTNLTPGPTARR